MQVAVQKIEIKIGNKTITLSPEEMKELRDVLDATFPKATYIPGAPIYIERPVVPVWPQPWRHWAPYWCDNTKTLSMSLNTN